VRPVHGRRWLLGVPKIISGDRDPRRVERDKTDWGMRFGWPEGELPLKENDTKPLWLGWGARKKTNI